MTSSNNQLVQWKKGCRNVDDFPVPWWPQRRSRIVWTWQCTAQVWLSRQGNFDPLGIPPLVFRECMFLNVPWKECYSLPISTGELSSAAKGIPRMVIETNMSSATVVELWQQGSRDYMNILLTFNGFLPDFRKENKHITSTFQLSVFWCFVSSPSFPCYFRVDGLDTWHLMHPGAFLRTLARKENWKFEACTGPGSYFFKYLGLPAIKKDG